MIIVDCEQGSDEWHAIRMGVPTASAFHRIVTRTGKLSAQRDKYLAELLVEYALGESISEFRGTFWTDRGKALEPEAMAYYDMVRGARPNRVGFVFRDQSRSVGCSPDFLVGDDGICEMKCPMGATHMLWWLMDCVPMDYWQQIQGQLWITGRDWCDFLSYCPGLPEVIHRVEPDAAFHAALDAHIGAFCEEISAGKQRLHKEGFAI